VPEIRIDPLTGLRAIVATDRVQRPGGELTVAPPDPIDPAGDPFAEGHEDQTPPELYALRPAGGEANGPGWTVRVVPNRFPALQPDAPEPEPDAHPELCMAVAARGAHEVIVNSPQPVVSLADLSTEQVQVAVDVWRERMRAQAGAAYVHVCVNERLEGGATQSHTHAQLFALSFVPAVVARERERFGAYAVRTMGGNLLEDLVHEEVRRRARGEQEHRRHRRGEGQREGAAAVTEAGARQGGGHSIQGSARASAPLSDPSPYVPPKEGWRFSRNAVTPSVKSADAAISCCRRASSSSCSSIPAKAHALSWRLTPA